MTKELVEVERLSSYFRNLELFQEYMDCCARHGEALDLISSQMDYLGDTDESLRQKFERLIHDVQQNQDILETRFSQFDFSEDSVRNTVSDYKIATYLYARESIRNEITQKSFTSFEDRQSYIIRMVSAIKEFFQSHFIVIDGLDGIFDQVVHYHLEGSPSRPVEMEENASVGALS